MASATCLCFCWSVWERAGAAAESGVSFSLVLTADVDGGKNEHGEESESLLPQRTLQPSGEQT